MDRIREKFDDPRPKRPAVSLDAWADVVLHLRHYRAVTFGADLFHDPAWDIILLLGCETNSPGLSLQEISIQINRSEESARRWLKILVERGHIETLELHNYRLASHARDGLSQIALAGSIPMAFSG